MGAKAIQEWPAQQQKNKQNSHKDAKQNKYVANEYKHRKQTNNLSNNTQEKYKDIRNLWRKSNSRK